MPNFLKSARPMMVITAIAVCLLVAMSEIDKIIASVQLSGGASHSVSSIVAPLQGKSAVTAAFSDWAKASADFSLVHWLLLHWLLDIVFIAAYVLVLLGAGLRWHIVPAKLILALAVADLAEDVCGIWLTALLPRPESGAAQGTIPDVAAAVYPHGFIATLMVVATWVKWIATLTLIVWAVYFAFRPALRQARVHLAVAVKIQRFNLVIVSLLIVLMIAPGSNIFDQITDIERSWLLNSDSGIGAVHLAAGVLCLLVLFVALVYLAELRIARTKAAYENQAAPPIVDHWYWWLVPPAIVLAVAGALRLLGWAHVDQWALLGPLVVLVGIAVIELVLTWMAINPIQFTHPIDLDMAEYVRRVGLACAIAVPSILGISLLRSFVGPLLLGAVDGRGVLAWAALLVGFAVGVGSWLGLIPLRNWSRDKGPAFWGTLVKPGDQEVSIVPGVLGASTLMVVAALAFWPKQLGDLLGVLGMLALGLASLTAILATLAFVAQRRRPLRLFRALHLQATPMITILLLIGALASTLDRAPDAHVVRIPSASAELTAAQAQWRASSLTQSAKAWLQDAQTSSCAIATGQQIDGKKVSIMPMLLVGAEGGGVRAAWWTVGALSHLTSSPCAEHSVFAASGASGGSIGMAVMLTDPNPAKAIGLMADAAPLAEAADGLVVRDVITGFTGIALDTYGSTAGDQFPDRARLLEQAWERTVPGLAKSFPLPPAGAAAPTADQAQVPWISVFNSTSARTGCRVLVSSVNLRPEGTGDAVESADCDYRDAQSSGPASYSLLAAQPCLQGLRTSTAALLSSRFPYVTPSGVVPGNCDSTKPVDQLIDGGYSDNSGIASLDDMTGQLMPLIRQHNADSVDGTMPNAPSITLVVPVILSLENTPRSAAASSSAAPPINEVLVPLFGLLRASSKTTDTRSLVAHALNSTADWLGACGPNCHTMTTAAGEALPARSIVVAPHQTPAVAAPLGWVMSQASRTSLTASLEDDVRCAGKRSPECPFGNLLKNLQAPVG